MNEIEYGSGGKRVSKGNGMYNDDKTRTARETARVAQIGDASKNAGVNWGTGASRSLYNVFSNMGSTEARGRDLLRSRLWKGVPQLTEEQLKSFEAAYTGHTFLFVVGVPRFMTTGIYENTNLHQQMKNLRAIIERASTGFNGPSNISADFDPQDDGNGRKLDHITRVTKEQSDITLRLHEFAGLPVKNALESWLCGIYDYRSEHGHYFGNLGIPGGWCLQNHSMSMLVVQVDPSWTEIQDAAYYFNMVPTEVPFDHFNWTKGDHGIVQDYDITFKCNEERSPAIMYAAEKYMNNRILSMVSTSVFNSRQFVIDQFSGGAKAGDAPVATLKQEYGGTANITDTYQYNIQTSGIDPDIDTKAEHKIYTKDFNDTIKNLTNTPNNSVEADTTDGVAYYTPNK